MIIYHIIKLFYQILHTVILIYINFTLQINLDLVNRIIFIFIANLFKYIHFAIFYLNITVYFIFKFVLNLLKYYFSLYLLNIFLIVFKHRLLRFHIFYDLQLTFFCLFFINILLNQFTLSFLLILYFCLLENTLFVLNI